MAEKIPGKNKQYLDSNFNDLKKDISEFSELKPENIKQSKENYKQFVKKRDTLTKYLNKFGSNYCAEIQNYHNILVGFSVDIDNLGVALTAFESKQSPLEVEVSGSTTIGDSYPIENCNSQSQEKEGQYKNDNGFVKVDLS